MNSSVNARNSATILAFAAVQDHALESVFRAHQERLIRFLDIRLGSVAEAQDAAQLVFAKLWERRTTLSSDNLIGLLYITARNVATDLIRSRKRRQIADRGHSGASELVDIRDEAPSADRIIAAREELHLITDLLKELPAKCRAAFVAYKLADRSYAEIAAEMGVTESMVRKYVLRAVAHCAARFKELECWA